jgi:hypothetical protein
MLSRMVKFHTLTWVLRNIESNVHSKPLLDFALRSTLPRCVTFQPIINHPGLSFKSPYHSHSRPSNSTKPPKMSWMDSWSRPRKDQATPAPYYLMAGGENTPYCRSCGRVIGSRKTANAASSGAGSTPARYCSAKCKSRKPGPVDREIERVFVRFLEGAEAVPIKETGSRASKGVKGGAKKRKGDPRILVPCDVVQSKMFGPSEQHREGKDGHGSESEPEEATAGDGQPETGQRKSVESSLASDDAGSSHAGDDMSKRMDMGLKTAREKEMVRCAARRGVVFGFAVSSEETEASEKGPVLRKCEAVMNGKVVEPSFAKGNWGIRWRED